MKLLSGQLAPDEGTITLANRVIMAYIEQHLPESLNTLSLADAVLEKLPAEQHLSEMWRAEMLLTEMGFDGTMAVTGHRAERRPAYPAVTGTGADQPAGFVIAG